MNNTRITISIPVNLKDALEKRIPPRQISRFVVRAIEEKIFEVDNEEDPVEEFFKLRKEMPKMSEEAVLKAIHKGIK